MKKILCLLFIFVASIQSYSQELRGVDFTLVNRPAFSALDSALLRRNSTMYSGKNAWGTADATESILFKWYSNKKKYYPVMIEAWKYCIDRLPYQLRLYRDGILLNQLMIGEAADSVSRAKYGNEIMSIYDKQIQNIDSINFYVKRLSDRSSKGNILMQKAYWYLPYVLGVERKSQVENDEDQLRPDVKAVMYPMYKEAIGVIKQMYDSGDDHGGGVSEGDIGLPYYLIDYFTYEFYHFADIFNAHLENDSINKSIRDTAKKDLLEEYNFMRDFCNRQIQELGADYVDTLSVDGGDSINVVEEKILKPYRDVLDVCNYYMSRAGINVQVQTLADADNMYYDELEIHKDSLAWLSRVKMLCENTTDFSPDSPYYPFYEDVCNYYDTALEKAKTTMSHKQITKYQRNQYEEKYQKLFAEFRKRYMQKDATAIRDACLCIYYLNLAKRYNPGSAARYATQKAYLSKYIASQAFWVSITRGQSITHRGVTFTVDY